jgi:hypothetical protein
MDEPGVGRTSRDFRTRSAVPKGEPEPDIASI